MYQYQFQRYNGIQMRRSKSTSLVSSSQCRVFKKQLRKQRFLDCFHKQVPKIIASMESALNQLKIIFNQENKVSNKNNINVRKKKSKIKNQIKKENKESIAKNSSIKLIMKAYKDTFGHQTQNLVELYEFYRKNPDKSTRIMGSLSLQNNAEIPLSAEDQTHYETRDNKGKFLRETTHEQLIEEQDKQNKYNLMNDLNRKGYELFNIAQLLHLHTHRKQKDLKESKIKDSQRLKKCITNKQVNTTDKINKQVINIPNKDKRLNQSIEYDCKNIQLQGNNYEQDQIELKQTIIPTFKVKIDKQQIKPQPLYIYGNQQNTKLGKETIGGFQFAVFLNEYENIPLNQQWEQQKEYKQKSIQSSIQQLSQTQVFDMELLPFDL